MVQFTGKMVYPTMDLKSWLPDFLKELQIRLWEVGQAFVKSAEREIPVYTGALKHSIAAGWGTELGVPISWKPPHPAAIERFGQEGVATRIMEQWGNSDVLFEDKALPRVSLTLESRVPYYSSNERSKGLSWTSPWFSFTLGRMAVYDQLNSYGFIAPPKLERVEIKI